MFNISKLQKYNTKALINYLSKEKISVSRNIGRQKLLSIVFNNINT